MQQIIVPQHHHINALSVYNGQTVYTYLYQQSSRAFIACVTNLEYMMSVKVVHHLQLFTATNYIDWHLLIDNPEKDTVTTIYNLLTRDIHGNTRY
jgi:hypothetical protein